MKAQVGDRIVIAPRAVGGVVRDGEILETRGPDGGPPYLVRWTDSGHEALYYPGVDAQVAAVSAQQAESAAPQVGAESPRPVRSWTVTVELFEEGQDTNAHAVLGTESPQHLDAHGVAHRRSADHDVPEIGDEIAVARALRHLADGLLGAAAHDIEVLEGRPVVLNDV
jgi:hypothetical protein